MGVGNVRTEDGHHPDGADPVGDIVGRRDRALVELLGQIEHKVGRDSIVRHPLEDFIHCTQFSQQVNAKTNETKKKTKYNKTSQID